MPRIRTYDPKTSNPSAYTARHPQSAEDEIGDFLWGVIRLTHPDHVLETGSYEGDTTRRMVDAVTRNGHGLVTTVELDPSRAEAVAKRNPAARVLTGSYDTVDLAPPDGGSYGVAFFDSHWERDREYHAARPFLRAGAVLAFHDCGPQHRHGMVRERVEGLMRDGLIRGFYIPCPRGVILAVNE